MKLSDKEFLKLYNLGFNDYEISRKTGASQMQVCRKRNKLLLPPVIKRHRLDGVFQNLYNTGKNDLDIAKLTGVPSSVVQAYRSKLGLPPIGPHGLDKNKLKTMLQEGYNDKEIANLTGYAIATVKKHRQKLGILLQNKRPNNYNYNDIEFQVILGSVLGDGNLCKKHKNGGTHLRITHSPKQKEYLEYKYQLLKNNSFSIRKYKFFDKRRKNPSYSEYCFYTKSSISLNDMYYNWYTPIKRIYEPDLFKIEPLGLAIWYMDDGSNCPDGGCHLCTNCFSNEDIVIIQKVLLSKFNLHTNVHKGNIIYIPKSDFFKFKDIIKPYIIPSMEYKLIKSHSKTPLNRETPTKLC